MDREAVAGCKRREAVTGSKSDRPDPVPLHLVFESDDRTRGELCDDGIPCPSRTCKIGRSIEYMALCGSLPQAVRFMGAMPSFSLYFPNNAMPA